MRRKKLVSILVFAITFATIAGGWEMAFNLPSGVQSLAALGTIDAHSVPISCAVKSRQLPANSGPRSTIKLPSEGEADQDNQVFLPLVLHPSQLSQPTFYVAANGDDGNGDGSQSHPWRTINYALETVPEGSMILVKPGTYSGMIRYERLVEERITLRSELPYKARLQNDAHVIQIYLGNGLTIEGFDISHSGPNADRYVIQIQDSQGDHQCGSKIILRNNVIHDSYNNDLVKINNNASYIVIEGNIFYNSGGPETDSHLDLNSVDFVTVQDNIFFNDYEGSGRINTNNSGHFIVLKDSNGGEDGHLGSNEITIRRNIFMNWQGNIGNAFIGLGDGSYANYYHAKNILIENNLMLGNSRNQIHAAFKSINAKSVVFRNNTIVGDLPANAYFIRTTVENPFYTNDIFEIYNNIWSDATGTMGADQSGGDNDFTISPGDTIHSFTIENNLYWNGQNPVPADSGDQIQYTADSNPFLLNPRLPFIPRNIILPRLDPYTGLIGGQFQSIRDAFVHLVETYGTPSLDSPVIDQAEPLQAPLEDILGQPRTEGAGPDIGAVEVTD